MTRVDLFTAPHCPACLAAREAVASFARERADVVVHEWDLTLDPGPAVGRGIVATPASSTCARTPYDARSPASAAAHVTILAVKFVASPRSSFVA